MQDPKNPDRKDVEPKVIALAATRQANAQETPWQLALATLSLWWISLLLR